MATDDDGLTINNAAADDQRLARFIGQREWVDVMGRGDGDGHASSCSSLMIVGRPRRGVDHVGRARVQINLILREHLARNAVLHNVSISHSWDMSEMLLPAALAQRGATARSLSVFELDHL